MTRMMMTNTSASEVDRGSRQRALNEAFDRLVYVVENGGERETRRYLVTRMIEVEAVDESQALLLAEHGEGIRYEAQVETIP